MDASKSDEERRRLEESPRERGDRRGTESAEPMAWHVTARLLGGRVVCRSAGARRCAARAVHAQGGARGMATFGLADTHLHAMLICDRETAGRFANYVESSLGWRLRSPVGFECARFTAVESQKHMGSTLWYSLRQEARHGTAIDPFHDGTILPDLVGARVMRVGEERVAGSHARQLIARWLPRIRPGQLMEELHLAPEGTPLPFDLLADAAAGAVGLTSVHTRHLDAIDARRALVHVGCKHLSRCELAELLEASPRAVDRLLQRPPRAAVVRALELQLRMRATRRQIETDAAASMIGQDAPPTDE
jgi:hypothetical protein